MNGKSKFAVMEFPLRGEWYSPQTPGTKIPSHGTEKFGSTYAYDFIQVDWRRKGRPAYRTGLLQYILFGVPITEYYAYGQAVYSPCDGVVVQAEDGYKENERTWLPSDLVHAYKSAHHFDPKEDDIKLVAGNYVIIQYDSDVYVALCHLKTGTVQVNVGQKIKRGEAIAKVGHSGNSFAPHLHMQLMDCCDITAAKGIPCTFERYDIYQNGKWKAVTNGIPTNKDRIRFLKTD